MLNFYFYFLTCNLFFLNQGNVYFARNLRTVWAWTIKDESTIPAGVRCECLHTRAGRSRHVSIATDSRYLLIILINIKQLMPFKRFLKIISEEQRTLTGLEVPIKEHLEQIREDLFKYLMKSTQLRAHSFSSIDFELRENYLQASVKIVQQFYFESKLVVFVENHHFIISAITFWRNLVKSFSQTIEERLPEFWCQNCSILQFSFQARMFVSNISRQKHQVSKRCCAWAINEQSRIMKSNLSSFATKTHQVLWKYGMLSISTGIQRVCRKGKQ